jgi:hypothetical protein
MQLTRREWAHAAMAGLVLSRWGTAQDATPAAGRSATAAAEELWSALSGAQRERIAFPWESKERFEWHFVPLNDVKTKTSTRKGVALAELPAAALTAANALLQACTSPEGFASCKSIMQREAILAELEPNNAWYRRPDWGAGPGGWTVTTSRRVSVLRMARS